MEAKCVREGLQKCCASHRIKKLDGTRVELACEMRCEARYQNRDLNIFRYFRIFTVIVVSTKQELFSKVNSY